MDNPARTAAHLARITQRFNDLEKIVAGILPPGTSFVCELGCGHGHFLTAYAAANPDRLCLGLDISGERIDRALRKRNRAKLSNLHFIQAEARAFLEALPPKTSFTDLYILFPDPWPKRRHHKNRLLQSDFLHAAAEHAGKGARLFFRTDDEPYFRATESLIEHHPKWQLADDPWPFEQTTVFQSRASQHHSLIARLRATRA